MRIYKQLMNSNDSKNWWNYTITNMNVEYIKIGNNTIFFLSCLFINLFFIAASFVVHNLYYKWRKKGVIWIHIYLNKDFEKMYWSIVLICMSLFFVMSIIYVRITNTYLTDESSPLVKHLFASTPGSCNTVPICIY